MPETLFSLLSRASVGPRYGQTPCEVLSGNQTIWESGGNHVVEAPTGSLPVLLWASDSWADADDEPQVITITQDLAVLERVMSFS